MAVEIKFVIRGGDGTYLYNTTLGYKHWKNKSQEATQYDSYADAEREIHTWRGGIFSIEKLFIVTNDTESIEVKSSNLPKSHGG